MGNRHGKYVVSLSTIQEETNKETWGLVIEEKREKEPAEKWRSEQDFPAPLTTIQEEPIVETWSLDIEEKWEDDPAEKWSYEKDFPAPLTTIQEEPIMETWSLNMEEKWEDDPAEKWSYEKDFPAPLTTIQEEPIVETWSLNMEEKWEDVPTEKWSSEKDFLAPLSTIQEEPNGEHWNSDNEEKWEEELPENHSLQEEELRDPSPSMERDPKNSNKWDPVTRKQWDPVTPEQWDPKTSKQWDPEIPEQWDPETPVQWDPEIPEQWVPETSEQWVPEASEQWDLETSKQWVPETPEQWVPETPEQWVPETPEQWVPKTPEQWDPESNGEWVPKPEEDWEPKSEEVLNIIPQERWQPISEDVMPGDRWEIDAEDIQPCAQYMEGAPVTPKKGGKFRAFKRGFRKLLGSIFSNCFPRQKKTRTESCSSGISDIQPAWTKPTSTAALSPDSFSFYDTLGEGSYGKVMLASHPSFGQQLAVKMVKKRQLIEEDPNSILIERQVLEMVRDCQFLTHTFATFQTENHLFFVMEYLSGGDLKSLIKAKAPLDVATIRFLTAEILCGLQHLHCRGIMHRDMKPDNILLDSTGHAKIADFGLAVTDMFGSRMIDECCGTVNYMAPEVHLFRPYNTTADYFSFGVIVYEMAVGSQPFYDEDDAKVRTSVCLAYPHYPEHVDPDVQDLIERLLYKTPRRRQELIENLRDHPVFSSIDWMELEARKIHPPFALEPRPVIDPHNYISVGDLMMDSEAQKPPISAEDQMLFTEFSFRSERWE